MLVKKWLKKWFYLTALLIIGTFIFILYIHHVKDVPLRLSNSISFDAKLSFLKKSNKLRDAEILIVGSSMGLNNISSPILAKELNNEHILNLSAWGLKAQDIAKILEMIDLKHVQKVIYLNQYFDFYGSSLGSYKSKDIKSFIYGRFSITPYLNTLYSLTSNFKDYIYWRKRFLDTNKYSNLNFNQYGDVGLQIDQKNIDSNRWNEVTDIRELKEHFEAFEDMIVLLRNKKIKLYIVTTPLREKIFARDDLTDLYIPYFNKMLQLHKKHIFRYINTQEILDLDDSYFVDSSHLNSKGATILANALSKSIKAENE